MDIATLSLRFEGDTTDLEQAFDRAEVMAEAFRLEMERLSEFNLGIDTTEFQSSMEIAAQSAREMADEVTDHFDRIRADAANAAVFNIEVSGVPEAIAEVEAFESRFESVNDTATYTVEADVDNFETGMDNVTRASQEMADEVDRDFIRMRQSADEGAQFNVEMEGVAAVLAEMEALRLRGLAFAGEMEALMRFSPDIDQNNFDAAMNQMRQSISSFADDSIVHFDRIRTDADRGANFNITSTGADAVRADFTDLDNRRNILTGNPVVMFFREEGAGIVREVMAQLAAEALGLDNKTISIDVDRDAETGVRSLTSAMAFLAEQIRAIETIGRVAFIPAIITGVAAAIPLVSSLGVGVLGLAGALGQGLVGAAGAAATALGLGGAAIGGYIASTVGLVGASVSAANEIGKQELATAKAADSMEKARAAVAAATPGTTEHALAVAQLNAATEAYNNELVKLQVQQNLATPAARAFSDQVDQLKIALAAAGGEIGLTVLPFLGQLVSLFISALPALTAFFTGLAVGVQSAAAQFINFAATGTQLALLQTVLNGIQTSGFSAFQALSFGAITALNVMIPLIPTGQGILAFLGDAAVRSAAWTASAAGQAVIASIWANIVFAGQQLYGVITNLIGGFAGLFMALGNAGAYTAILGWMVNISLEFQRWALFSGQGASAIQNLWSISGPVFTALGNLVGTIATEFMRVSVTILGAQNAAGQPMLANMLNTLTSLVPIVANVLITMFQSLGNSLPPLFVQIGQLVQAFAGLAPVVSFLIGIVTNILSLFNSLPGPVQTVILAVFTLGTAFQAAGILLGITGAGGLIGGLLTFGLRLAALPVGIGILNAALGTSLTSMGALTAASNLLGISKLNLIGIITGQTTVFAALSAVWTGLTGAFSAGLGILTTTAVTIGAVAVPVWAVIAAVAALAGAVYLIYQNWGTIGPYFQAIWQPVVGFFQSAWSTIQSVIISAFNAVVTFLTPAWNTVTSFIVAQGQYVVSWWNTNWPLIQQIWQTVWGAISSVVSSIWSAVGGLVTQVGGTIVSWFQTNMPQIQTITQAVWGAISAIISGAMAVIGPIVSGVLTFLAALWQSQGANILQIIQGSWTMISSVIAGVLQIVLGIISVALNLLTGNWSGAWNALVGVLQSAWNMIQGVISGAIQVVLGIIMGALQPLLTLFGTTWSQIGAATISAWNAIASAATTAWSTVRNAVVGAVQPLLPLLSGIWQGIQAAASAAWLAIRMAIIIPISLVIALILLAWRALAPQLTAIWTALRITATAVFGALAAAIGAVWNVIRNAAIAAWNAIRAALLPVWNALLAAARTVFAGGLTQVLVQAWNVIRNATLVAWNAIRTTLVTVWNGIIAVGRPIFTTLQTVITTVWNAIRTVTQTVWSAISAFLQPLWNALVTAARTIFEAMRAAIQTVWTAIQTVTTTVWNAVRAFLEPLWNALSTAVTTIWNAMQTAIQTAWTAVQTVTTTVWNAIRALLEPLWTALRTFVETTWTAMRTAIETAWNAINTATTTVWNAIRAFLEPLWTALRTFIETTWTAIQTFIDTAWRAIETTTTTIWNAISTFVQGIAQTIYDNVSNIIGQLRDWLSETWETIKSTAETAWQALWDNVSSIFESGISTVIGWLDTLLAAMEEVISWIPGQEDVAGQIGEARAALGGLGFAKGGVVTADGGVTQYAEGGVAEARSPRMHMWGEGDSEEAFIVKDRPTGEQLPYLSTAADWHGYDLLDRNADYFASPDVGGTDEDVSPEHVGDMMGHVSGSGEGLGGTHWDVEGYIADRANAIAAAVGGSWNTYYGHGEPGGSWESVTVDIWGPGGRGDPLWSSGIDAATSMALSSYGSDLMYMIGNGSMWRGSWFPFPEDPHYDHAHISWGGDGTGGGGGMFNWLRAKIAELLESLMPSVEDIWPGGGWLADALGSYASTLIEAIKSWFLSLVPGGGASGALDQWITDGIAMGGVFTDDASTHSALVGRAMQESSGDPNAVNDWDINAMNGTPSKGLFQIIEPTWNTWAGELGDFSSNWSNPVVNTAVATRYMQGVYGGPVGPTGSGYDVGGIVPGMAGMPSNILAHAGERILPAGVTDSFDRLADVVLEFGRSDTRVDNTRNRIGAGGGGGDTYVFQGGDIYVTASTGADTEEIAALVREQQDEQMDDFINSIATSGSGTRTSMSRGRR